MLAALRETHTLPIGVDVLAWISPTHREATVTETNHDATRENRPDVPRTYRSGPSDPLVFGDGPGTYAEVAIAAPASRVWEAVTDIELPARFSDEFLGAEWIGDGPALGATFNSRNENSTIGRWELICHVDRYEEERVFGWATSDPENPGARWWYTLTPTPDGTTLRLEVSIGPGSSGLSMVIASMPDKESRILAGRLRELHANMVRTVEGIRDVVESAQT